MSSYNAEKLFQNHIPALIMCCKETGPAYRKLMSNTINAILNECGYTEERIKEQIQTFTKLLRARRVWGLSSQHTNSYAWSEVIAAGSQIEGSMIYGSSDVDTLNVFNSPKGHGLFTECIDTYEEIYVIETDRVPTGYCMLRRCIPGGPEGITLGGYISSKAVMHNAKIQMKPMPTNGGFLSTLLHGQQGPSTPVTVTNYGMINYPADIAYAIYCHYPNLLQTWRYRRRPQNWPTQEVLDKVASLPVFAVPVAQKGTDLEHLQWRFCFNLGEIILTHSLNHTQLKVYILLKMIAKYLLKPICDDMTSFIMKNVVFWLAELKPVEEFTSATLLDRLIDALTLLRECIDAKQLNYYMIPERNLLAGKLTATQQCRLIDFLTLLITHDGQDYLKLHIPDENVEKAKQSLDSVKSMYVKLFRGNIEARSSALNILPLSIEEVANKLERTSDNYMRKKSLFGVHFLTSAASNVCNGLSKFGFKMFNDPLGVKHESIVDPTLDVDDYDMWVCPTCRRIALIEPQTSQSSRTQRRNVDFVEIQIP